MTENNISLKARVRFKLISGEEFEAEGTPEFIKEQKNDFLTLINKKDIKKQSFSENRFAKQELNKDKVLEEIPNQIPHQQDDLNSYEMNPWPQILHKEGEILVLNRKGKLLPHEACLLLLAGGIKSYNLREYSAINLSKSLQSSGFSNIGRLDRLLNNEIQGGFVSSQGNKRSRNYILTQEGIAKAFLLAEQFIKK